jgi:hypothetical protein
VIAQSPKEDQNYSMKMIGMGAALSLAFCVSAFAGGGENVVMQKYQAVQHPKKVVYLVRSTASAIPQPIDRLGGIPTTTAPLQVLGDPRVSNQGP